MIFYSVLSQGVSFWLISTKDVKLGTENDAMTCCQLDEI